MKPAPLRYAVLSIVAALATILLKVAAYGLTGSVGLLSDALESLVNLASAFGALLALAVAARPADEAHTYGHGKAEYFAGGFEGALILVAAAGIVATAVPRLLQPAPITDAWEGVAVSTFASGINLAVALVLLRAGRRYRSIALDADARHLLTDVWTSVGVLVAVVAVAVSDWLILDPLIALAVAVNIVWTGVRLLQRSALGLLDTALPERDLTRVRTILDSYTAEGIRWHAMRSRQGGARRFVSFHVLVPGSWSVQAGHDLLERIEDRIHRELPATTVFTHLEPLNDPASDDDVSLDRPADAPASESR